MEKQKITFDEVEIMVDEFTAGNSDLLARVDFVVGVSRGGLVPAALLAAKINKPLVAVYIDKQDAIFFDRGAWIENKNLLVVDDIIRSGRTLWLLRDYLQKNTKPASISFYALGRVKPLSNKNYEIASLTPEISYDLIFPWDN